MSDYFEKYAGNCEIEVLPGSTVGSMNFKFSMPSGEVRTVVLFASDTQMLPKIKYEDRLVLK
jgi:hypothetical protein